MGRLDSGTKGAYFCEEGDLFITGLSIKEVTSPIVIVLLLCTALVVEIGQVL